MNSYKWSKNIHSMLVHSTQWTWMGWRRCDVLCFGFSQKCNCRDLPVCEFKRLVLCSTVPISGLRKRDKPEKDETGAERVPQGPSLFYWTFFVHVHIQPCGKHHSVEVVCWLHVFVYICLYTCIRIVRWALDAQAELQDPVSRGDNGQVHQVHGETARPQWWSCCRTLWWTRFAIWYSTCCYIS